MKIYLAKGSNQYVQKKKTPRFGPAIAFMAGALILAGIVVPAGVSKDTEMLQKLTFGKFPSVVVAVEPAIAGTSAELQKPATVENVVSEIAKVFGPHGKVVVKQALDVSMCESGWRAEAINKNTNLSTDYNIFQVNSLWTKVFGNLYQNNWVENIRVAHEIYLRSHSFGPWVCAKKLGIVK